MAKLMKRWTTGIVAVAVLAALPACDGARKSLIQQKKAPDEFAVYSRAPLTIPPNYGLRPPTPGAPRPGGKDPAGQAYQAMTGRNAPPRAEVASGDFKGSHGEQVLLRQANALNTDPAIRDTVNRETSVLAEESKTVTEKLLFSNSTAAYGERVDADKESQRLRENQALGKPLNEGEVPVIRRKKKGLLEGLIN